MSDPQLTNLYPNNGEYFGLSTPQEQTDAHEKEKSEVFEALPQLQKILEHIDQRIAFYSDVDSVSPEVLANETEFMHAVAVNKGLKAGWKEERTALALLISEHTRPE